MKQYFQPFIGACTHPIVVGIHTTDLWGNFTIPTSYGMTREAITLLHVNSGILKLYLCIERPYFWAAGILWWSDSQSNTKPTNNPIQKDWEASCVIYLENLHCKLGYKPWDIDIFAAQREFCKLSYIQKSSNGILCNHSHTRLRRQVTDRCIILIHSDLVTISILYWLRPGWNISV